MKQHRLNVTNAERLCYSRRKLQAISAMRNAGLKPTIFGLHKDYRVPGVRGKVYLVRHALGGAYAFSTLAAIHRYAAVCRAWRTQPRLTWDLFFQGPPRPDQPQAYCVWPECHAPADATLEGHLLCQGHALVEEGMPLASDRWAVPEAPERPILTASGQYG